MVFRTPGKTTFAIQASAGIPARRIFLVVAPDRDLVLAVKLEMLGQIAAKRRISVRPAADILAIYPNFGIAHRSVRLEKEPSASFYEHRFSLVQLERIAIPANSCRFEVGVPVRL